MGSRDFVDYYEALQVDPRAEPATITRVYRHLAKRYHPDNAETGDRERFDRLAEAHEVLTDPEKRAAYDQAYADVADDRLRLLDDAIAVHGRADDAAVRERLLAVLYTQRRRDVVEPSVGEVQLERALGESREDLAFHLWYLKEKRCVERTDRGFAITVAGIDAVEESRARARAGAPAQLGAGEPESEAG